MVFKTTERTEPISAIKAASFSSISKDQYARAIRSRMYISTTRRPLPARIVIAPLFDQATPRISRPAILRCESGAAAVEFAFVLPILLLLLLGMISYGGYFWLAHDVQQLANDAARAAIGGIDASERTSIANATVQRNLQRQNGLDAPRTTVLIREADEAFSVTVSYDASSSPFWALYDLLPMPSPTIDRTATVTLGGL